MWTLTSNKKKDFANTHTHTHIEPFIWIESGSSHISIGEMRSVWAFYSWQVTAAYRNSIKYSFRLGWHFVFVAPLRCARLTRWLHTVRSVCRAVWSSFLSLSLALSACIFKVIISHINYIQCMLHHLFVLHFCCIFTLVWCCAAFQAGWIFHAHMQRLVAIFFSIVCALCTIVTLSSVYFHCMRPIRIICSYAMHKFVCVFVCVVKSFSG